MNLSQSVHYDNALGDNEQQIGGTLEKSTNKRTKNWATVLYEESSKENWLEILKESHIPALISPIHDRDKTEDGKLKKAHRHILILFDGQKTYEQAKEVFDSIGGVGVEKVESIRGYTRYLSHMDNPEKAQYDPKEVIALSGANYEFLIELPGNKYRVIGEVLEYCMENNVHSYANLLLYAKNENPEWFSVLCDNAHTITQFLKSRTWTEKR